MLNKPYRILFCLLLSFSISLNSYSQDLFTQSNKLYDAGDYTLALQYYDSIENSGVQSSELFYNKANAAFKLNQNGKAILYYEKALKLNPSFEDARYNIDFISSALKIPKNTSYGPSIAERVSTLFGGNYNVLSWLAISFSIIASLLIGIKFSKKFSAYNSLVTSLIGIGISLALVCFILSKTIQSHSQNTSGAIATTSIEVMNEPSGNSSIAYKLSEGSKVLILEENQEWAKVIFSDKIGWVNKSLVRRI